MAIIRLLITSYIQFARRFNDWVYSDLRKEQEEQRLRDEETKRKGA